jgi:hypothetical protein
MDARMQRARARATQRTDKLCKNLIDVSDRCQRLFYKYALQKNCTVAGRGSQCDADSPDIGRKSWEDHVGAHE